MAILYVNQSATGSNDGNSWGNAYTDLQDAITEASAGDEIWVAKGTYKPTTGTNRFSSFTLKNNVEIYGGFAGTETSREQRDFENNETILSGEIGDSTNTDNSYNVVNASSKTSTAVLDGFTITEGYANNDANLSTNISSTDQYRRGGGVYYVSSSATLANLVITNNRAVYGGGMYSDGTSPNLDNITFSNNSTINIEVGLFNERLLGIGGGIYIGGNSLTLTNANFSNNSSRTGGAIYNSANLTLDNANFSNNSGSTGGAIYNANSITVTNTSFNNNSGRAIYNNGGNSSLTNVNFNGNSGGIYNEDSDSSLNNVNFDSNNATNGGAIYNFRSNSEITNSTFKFNTAGGGTGGAIYNVGDSDTSSNTVITNSLFRKNSSTSDGGVIYNNNYTDTKITNSTFTENISSSNGGAIFSVETTNDSARPSITINNSILWENEATISEDEIGGTTAVVNNSIVEGGYSGTGNKQDNPLFVDAANDNFRLQPTSPAINAGNNNSLPEDVDDLDNDGDTSESIPFDLDGNPRIVNGTVDMGAYELGIISNIGITISDVSLLEGDSGSQNFGFNVSLSRSSSETVTVDYTTADSTATAGSDYTATTGTLTFNPGETSQTIDVPVIGDTVDESNETFVVNLSNPTNATISDSEGVGTIDNDDEKIGSGVFITFDEDPLPNSSSYTVGNITISSAFTDGTYSNAPLLFGSQYYYPGAIPPMTGNYIDINRGHSTGGYNALRVDFENTVNYFSIAVSAADTEMSVLAYSTDDKLIDSSTILYQGSTANDFTVSSASPDIKYVLVVPTANDWVHVDNLTDINDDSGTRVDVDTELSLLVDISESVDNQEYKTQIEGYIAAFNNENLFNDFIDEGINKQVAVNLIVWAGEDQIQEVVGWTLINSVESSQDFATAIGDTLLPENGGSRPFDGATAPGDAIDFAVPGFSSNIYDGRRWKIDLSADGKQNDGINPATARDNALAAGVDAINAIVISDDSTLVDYYEDNLIGGTGAFVSQTDDFSGFEQGIYDKLTKELTPLPLLSIADFSLEEGDNGTTDFVFDVTLSESSTEDVTVDFTTLDGSAIAGNDYTATNGTLTFAAGETTQQITVSVTGENRLEINENFFVNLSNATNAEFSDNQGEGTILNDDEILISNDNVDENSPEGTVVGLISATDPGDTDPFTFSLLNDAGGRFKIVGNELQVANGELLDFESNDSHSVIIRATDSKGNNFDQTFIIEIKDVNEAPSFGAVFTIEENSPEGTFVTQISATDPENDALTYAITSGNIDPDGDGTAAFAIDSATGRITVADSGDLDFETTPTFNLNLTVTDTNNLSDNATIRINLADVDESVPENNENTDSSEEDNSEEEPPIADDATLVLEANSDDQNGIFSLNAGDNNNLKFTLDEVGTDKINEVGLFIVDDENGNINGIAPGEEGYLQAALEKAQVIFSAISDVPTGFNLGDIERILEVDSDAFLGFYMTSNASTDEVLTQLESSGTTTVPVFFSNSSNMRVADLDTDSFTIEWSEQAFSSDSPDITLNAELSSQTPALGTKLQRETQQELIDLTEVTDSVAVEVQVYREAAQDNLIGFYEITDINGGIDIDNDGVADINPGDAGYKQAALTNRITGLDLLQTENQTTSSFSGTFDGDSILTPFIIVDATVDEALSDNAEVYFSFLGANSDGVDHIRLLGDNIFGFEDLAAGGDFDFNDVMVKIKVG